MAGPAAQARPDRPVLQAVARGRSRRSALRSRWARAASYRPVPRPHRQHAGRGRWRPIASTALAASTASCSGRARIRGRGRRRSLCGSARGSLNYRDLMVLKGGGRGPTKVGVVPQSDGAGEVAAIGEGVTRVKIGDRIAGCFHPRWFGGPIKPDYLTDRLGANLDGMLAEYAVFNEEAVVLLPSHPSFEEAATLPCAAVTAWVALTGHRRVTAGDIVLTQGSGGVSVFALQFARPLFGRGRMRSRPLPLPVCDLVPFSGCIVYRGHARLQPVYKCCQISPTGSRLEMPRSRPRRSSKSW